MYQRPVFENTPFTDEDKVEILTRVAVRTMFKSTLKWRELEDDLVDDLQNVLFDLAYPTPPISLLDCGDLVEP